MVCHCAGLSPILRKLSVGENKLKELPESIGQLAMLEELVVYKNEVPISVLQHCPRHCFPCSLLTTM